MATGRGDDGTTGLLYGGPRIRKDDPRAEAYGTVDEAVAALGPARAELRGWSPGTPLPADLGDLILRLQRELFVVGAELATTPGAHGRLEDGRTRVSLEMLAVLEADLAAWEAWVTMPTEFVVPGESRLSAAIEVARATVRRAERRAVALGADAIPADSAVVPYLNRLADLLWILARAAEQAEARESTPSRVRGGETTG